MRDLARGHQRALLAQPIDDDGVGVVGVKAGERASIGSKHAVVVDGHKDGDVELQAHQVVVLAVTRRGVHAAGTGIKRDVVAVDDLALEVVADGARVGKARQLGALQRDRFAVFAAHHVVRLPARDLGDLLHQLLREDHIRAVCRDHDVVGVGH